MWGLKIELQQHAAEAACRARLCAMFRVMTAERVRSRLYWQQRSAALYAAARSI